MSCSVPLTSWPGRAADDNGVARLEPVAKLCKGSDWRLRRAESRCGEGHCGRDDDGGVGKSHGVLSRP